MGWIDTGNEDFDDDRFYDDYDEEEDERRHSSNRNKSGRKQRPVEDDYDDEDDDFDLRSKAGKSRRTGSNVHDFYSRERPEKKQGAKLLLCYPTELSDATAICDHLKSGTICIVNMTGIDSVTAQRTTDVLSGMTYALNGELQRIDDPIYVIAPAHTKITHDLKEELRGMGADEFFGKGFRFK